MNFCHSERIPHLAGEIEESLYAEVSSIPKMQSILYEAILHPSRRITALRMTAVTRFKVSRK